MKTNKPFFNPDMGVWEEPEDREISKEEGPTKDFAVVYNSVVVDVPGRTSSGHLPLDGLQDFVTINSVDGQNDVIRVDAVPSDDATLGIVVLVGDLVAAINAASGRRFEEKGEY